MKFIQVRLQTCRKKMRHSADVEPVAKSCSRKKSCSEALYKFTWKALLTDSVLVKLQTYNDFT